MLHVVVISFDFLFTILSYQKQLGSDEIHVENIQ